MKNTSISAVFCARELNTRTLAELALHEQLKDATRSVASDMIWKRERKMEEDRTKMSVSESPANSGFKLGVDRNYQTMTRTYIVVTSGPSSLRKFDCHQTWISPLNREHGISRSGVIS